MIELKKRVGRLLTIRFLSPVTDEEWARFERDVLEIVKMAPSQLIFCTDMRGAILLPDKIAEKIIAAMRANSPKIKRAAVIVPSDGAILALQTERIVREVGYSWRRTFRRERAAIAWLSEVLLPAEQESLSAFITEFVPGSRPPPPPGPGSHPSSTSSRPPPGPGNHPSSTSSRPPPGPGTWASSPGGRLSPIPGTGLLPGGGGKPSGGGKE